MNQREVHERQLQEAYLEGHKAGYQDRHSSSNPHIGVTTAKHKKWIHGWTVGKNALILEARMKAQKESGTQPEIKEI